MNAGHPPHFWGRAVLVNTLSSRQPNFTFITFVSDFLVLDFFLFALFEENKEEDGAGGGGAAGMEGSNVTRFEFPPAGGGGGGANIGCCCCCCCNCREGGGSAWGTAPGNWFEVELPSVKLAIGGGDTFRPGGGGGGAGEIWLRGIGAGAKKIN